MSCGGGQGSDLTFRRILLSSVYLSASLFLMSIFLGTGVYISIDGDLYRGAWRNDKMFGRGVYVWPDGQMYTGDYVDGLRKGKG
jgi:hypothetical protein